MPIQRMPIQRTPIQRILILTLLITTQLACTSNRVASEVASGFEWAGLRSHTDLDASTRWQIPSGSAIRIEALDTAVNPAWLRAAEEGVYQVFQPVPADAPSDLLLRVDWPRNTPPPPENSTVWQRIGGLMPGARDRVEMRLFLCDAGSGRVLQSAALTVDPHWFSPGSARPDQLRDAFATYARSLTSRH